MEVFRVPDPGRAAGGEEREGNLFAGSVVLRRIFGAAVSGLPGRGCRVPLQLFRQLLRFLHDGQVRAQTGIEYRVKAHHAHGGEHSADAVLAGLQAEGLADGHADGGSDLGDNALLRIIDLAPDAVVAGLDADGGRRADGGALAAVDAVGFRKLFPEGRGDDRLGAALGEINGAHMLYLVADSHAVAAENALAGVADDGR